MKKIMLTAIMATLTLGAFAQSNRNWFVSVGGGVNVYSDGGITKGPGTSFALDASVGKWFTPASGVRLQYAGIAAKGLSGRPVTKKNGFNTIHADYIWNISNTIGGDKDRLWSFVPFAGVGAGFGPGKARFAVSVGLLNQIRLCNHLDLNLEARAISTTKAVSGATVKKFSGRTVGSLTLGLGYNF